MVEIRQVRTRRDLIGFVKFQNALYSESPYYVPALLADELSNLDPKKNPAYEYCDTRLYMAYKNGKPVGRICGLLNKRYNKLWNKRRMRFCRFDFIDDHEVSKALLNAVEEWALELGMIEIMGPIGFCDLDKEGMLVEGFDEMGMYITLYNHSYYPQHMADLGYTKEVDWVEYAITVSGRNERITKIAKVVERRLDLHRLSVRNKKEIKSYLGPVFELVNEAYKPLFGTVPLTDRQIDFYVKQFLTLVDIGLISLVADRNGKLVGFGLAVPSLSEGVRRTGGRLFPFGIFKILNGMKKAHVLDLYLIAVAPEYQGKGVNAIIMDQMQDNIIGRFTLAETGPELEMNTKVQAQWGDYDTRQHKRRRCYLKRLGAEEAISVVYSEIASTAE